jgi:hypothetical protein
MARLSNDTRKTMLYCMTMGKPNTYVLNSQNHKYSYIYKHLIKQYGDGSPHVPFQEKYDLLHQHDDEQIEEFGSRWCRAFKRRFGSHFKINTTKNMKDLVRVLANEYVKTHLAALKFRKFEDVVRHGGRSQHEAVSMGVSPQYGPRSTSSISYQSDYAGRREYAPVLAATHPTSSDTPETKTSFKFQRRWRGFSRFSTSKLNSTSIKDTAKVAQSIRRELQSRHNDDEDVEDASDDDSSPRNTVSDCDDDDAQFISYVESTITELHEAALTQNSDKILQE